MPSHYTKKNTRLRKRIGKIAGGTAILLGVLALVYFFFPLVSYQIFLKPALAQGTIESPIPKTSSSTDANLPSLLTQSVSHLTTDYTDARNWFPQAGELVHAQPKVTKYQISIPKLGLQNAQVSTDTYDLATTLVQYYGNEAPPGKGSAVIYGHSSLPQWFDPQNYKTIFATVHNLELGDDIIATVNGKTYRYKVFSMNITTSDDPNIFSQSYDNSYITLVTCTPPGTTWKRLIVRASLEKQI